MCFVDSFIASGKAFFSDYSLFEGVCAGSKGYVRFGSRMKAYLAWESSQQRRVGESNHQCVQQRCAFSLRCLWWREPLFFWFCSCMPVCRAIANVGHMRWNVRVAFCISSRFLRIPMLLFRLYKSDNHKLNCRSQIADVVRSGLYCLWFWFFFGTSHKLVGFVDFDFLALWIIAGRFSQFGLNFEEGRSHGMVQSFSLKNVVLRCFTQIQMDGRRKVGWCRFNVELAPTASELHDLDVGRGWPTKLSEMV